MADLTLTFTARIINGVAGQHGYQEEIDGAPNPETKKQFVVRMIKEGIKNAVVSYEAVNGGETERKRLKKKAENEVNI